MNEHALKVGRQPHSDEELVPIIRDLVSWKLLPHITIPPNSSLKAQQLRDLVQLASDGLVFGVPESKGGDTSDSDS
jgi:hypothetical protein